MRYLSEQLSLSELFYLWKINEGINKQKYQNK